MVCVHSSTQNLCNHRSEHASKLPTICSISLKVSSQAQAAKAKPWPTKSSHHEPNALLLCQAKPVLQCSLRLHMCERANLQANSCHECAARCCAQQLASYQVVRAYASGCMSCSVMEPCFAIVPNATLPAYVYSGSLAQPTGASRSKTGQPGSDSLACRAKQSSWRNAQEPSSLIS